MLRDVISVEIRPEFWSNMMFAIIIGLGIVLSVHFLTPKPLAMSGETSATLTTQNERYTRALRNIERAGSLNEAKRLAGEALR